MTIAGPFLEVQQEKDIPQQLASASAVKNQTCSTALLTAPSRFAGSQSAQHLPAQPSSLQHNPAQPSPEKPRQAQPRHCCSRQFTPACYVSFCFTYIDP